LPCSHFLIFCWTFALSNRNCWLSSGFIGGFRKRQIMEIELIFVIVEAIFIAILLLLLACVKSGGVTRKSLFSFFFISLFWIRKHQDFFWGFCSSRCAAYGALTSTSVPSEFGDLTNRECSPDVEAGRSWVRIFLK